MFEKRSLFNTFNIHGPLLKAIQYGHLDIVQFFIDNGVQKNEGIIIASRYGQLDIVKLLIKYDESIHVGNESSLQYASKYGHEAVVEYLLQQGSFSLIAFHNAIKYNKFSIVKLFLKYHNHYTFYEIMLATEYDHLEIFKLFKYMDSDIFQLFQRACRFGSLEIAKYITTFTDKSIITSNKNYSIRFASKNGHYEIVKFLLENNADIHTDDDYPIRIASQKGHLKVVELLIEKNANIHALNGYALQWADVNYHTDIVDLLLLNGAHGSPRNYSKKLFPNGIPEFQRV